MFHIFIIRHFLFRLLCLSVTLLSLSRCAEDLDTLFNSINTDALYQNPAISVSDDHSSSKTTSDTLQKLTIISHPKSATVIEQQPLTLTVKAQSSLPVQYQWYKNNLLIAGANQPTFHIPESQAHDQGFYHVVLKTDHTELRSLTAKVSYWVASPVSPFAMLYQTVMENPVQILRQPSGQMVTKGSAFSLSVSASSSRQLNYQWYRNDIPVIGANSPTYTVLHAVSSDQGRYSVRVGDESYSIRSSTALVTVDDPTTAAIELSWDTPSKREDGSPLSPSDIKAYLIQYGRNFYDLAQNIKVPHQAENRFVLREINSGILYLRIATIDAAGNRGAFSETISVRVN